MTKKSVAVFLMSLVLPMAALAAQEPACPLHAQHQAEAAQALDQRGDKVMGFEHTRTTHHFLVEPDGGVIQVEATDAGNAADAASLGQIRQHLAQMAESFAKGDFSMPAEIHSRVLPGVPEMIRLKDAIRYRYEEIGKGARVRITTESPEARAAVHEFLQAQIGDHRTGDPTH